MKRAVLVLGMLVALAGCGAQAVWAPEDEVRRWAYVHDAPPSITLLTVISNSTGGGAHAALLINGSQRVLFDPAGTWRHPQLPERDDVHFGIQPRVMPYYIDYHSRITYHLVEQELQVSPELAEAALREVMAYGAVAKAHCTVSVSRVLRNLGFDVVPQTYFPKQAMEAFAQVPGVIERKHYDDDPHFNGTIEVPGLIPPGDVSG